jgi:hypothetical protein
MPAEYRWAATSAPQPSGASPKFMVRALRDPDGANLDRIQIIKGWLDGAGNTHERIYDIACADRAIVDGACATAVGDTVNVEDASYTNTIGDAVLGAYWEDPDFDPSQKAFYHSCRTHLPLQKAAPEQRTVQSPSMGRVIAVPKVGGLHHYYTRLVA